MNRWDGPKNLFFARRKNLPAKESERVKPFASKARDRICWQTRRSNLLANPTSDLPAKGILHLPAKYGWQVLIPYVGARFSSEIG